MSALEIPDLDPEASILDAALAYAAAGWYIAPTDPARDVKNPGTVLGGGWPSKTSRDPKQIAAWFAGTDYGIALHCGRSGALFFDVDRPEAVPPVLSKYLADTPHQCSRPETPGRGHYPFLQPADRLIGNGTGKLGGSWGEVRGLNGVIIAAPTPHPAGGLYRWERTGLVAPLPDELAAALPTGTPAEDAATDAQIAAFLKAHNDSRRPEVLHGFKRAFLKKVEAGESRHDTACSVMAGAFKEARAGYYPAQAAIDIMRPIFLSAVGLGTNKRTGANAAGEWAGIVAWAVGQALAADLEEVRARTEAKMPSNVETVDGIPGAEKPAPINLDTARAVFRRWFGDGYDTQALDLILAAAAVERFTDSSDPLWVLVVGGPGAAKTESVQPLQGIGAVVTSALSSEAALLSATPQRERRKDATGGLLRKVGDRGVLVIKDVTSILSMNRDLRARVLAALREVYDGSWYREVGTDGGLTIPWHGRIAVVGAVTTAWDTAHAVIASMGDRFVLLRLDCTERRQAAGRQAIGNTGSEVQMRAELAEAVAGVIAGMNPDPITVTEGEQAVLLAAADLVTLARTAVEYDYRGDVIDAHAPEMPTRFAKQLTQIVRGAVSVGMDRGEALRLAIRCARDSMPPLRLAIIDDLAAHPHSSTGEIRRRVDKPRNTVDRQLQALHMLGVLAVDEVEYGSQDGRSRWFYSLAAGIDPTTLDPKSVPEMSFITPSPSRREGGEEDSPELVPDKSGTPEPDSVAHCRSCGRTLTPAQTALGHCYLAECAIAAQAVNE